MYRCTDCDAPLYSSNALINVSPTSLDIGGYSNSNEYLCAPVPAVIVFSPRVSLFNVGLSLIIRTVCGSTPAVTVALGHTLLSNPLSSVDISPTEGSTAKPWLILPKPPDANAVVQSP